MHKNKQSLYRNFWYPRKIQDQNALCCQLCLVSMGVKEAIETELRILYETSWEIVAHSDWMAGCPIAPLSAVQCNIKHTMCWCKGNYTQPRNITTKEWMKHIWKYIKINCMTIIKTLTCTSVLYWLKDTCIKWENEQNCHKLIRIVSKNKW